MFWYINGKPTYHSSSMIHKFLDFSAEIIQLEIWVTAASLADEAFDGRLRPLECGVVISVRKCVLGHKETVPST